MNTFKSVHGSSQTPPTNPSFSIEILDSSVQTLIKSWQRRQRWLLVLHDLNRPPWRTHLANFLESTWVRIFSILLLILDLLLTVLELSSSLLSCQPNKNNRIEELISLFHWVGIGILSLLSAKTMALIVGLGSSFFRHPGYVMDGIVVFGALIVEAFLEKKGGGLLVVVSLWRVIRVVETAFELSDEAIEAQIEGIVCQFEALREENRRLLETIDEKNNTIQKLEEDLDQCCQPKPVMINS